MDHDKVTETYVVEIVQNKHIVENAFTLKLLLKDSFEIKCFLENLLTYSGKQRT